MIRPGYEQQHLSGEAAFRSFVPVSLQEVVRDGRERQIAGEENGASETFEEREWLSGVGGRGLLSPTDSGDVTKELFADQREVTGQESAANGVRKSSVRGELESEAAEAWLLDKKIRSGAERIAALIQELNEKWVSLGETERLEAEERILRAEAEQSVMLAYPVKPDASAGSCMGMTVGNGAGAGSTVVDMNGAGRAGCADTAEEYSVQDTSGGISWDLSALQALSAEEKRYTLEDVPDEFRWMAEMDFDHLYHAAKEGLELLERLPLSGRLLKDIHYIALYGPHYDKLYRGEFRNSPVWIGLPDGSLQSAEFVPPVEEAMLDAFSELEKFIHYEEETDPLIKAVLLHYQFETIHPFLDGNGRMGRLLVQLYLKEFCGLQMPWIPLSRVLIRGMDRYYRELRLVQTTGDYFRWTCWFTRILQDALELALQEL